MEVDALPASGNVTISREIVSFSMSYGTTD